MLRWTWKTGGRRAWLAAAGAAVAAGILAGHAAAGSENYLPLVLGNRWEYALPGGDTEIQVVDRT
ncbi:MAG TPA: hypothetical protein VNM87_13425, partial [Candidatus Udaeobacter sp.]|nr:hypothetical protein [Candidatus Udaeobacter sp.]